MGKMMVVIITILVLLMTGCGKSDNSPEIEKESVNETTKNFDFDTTSLNRISAFCLGQKFFCDNEKVINEKVINEFIESIRSASLEEIKYFDKNTIGGYKFCIYSGDEIKYEIICDFGSVVYINDMCYSYSNINYEKIYSEIIDRKFDNITADWNITSASVFAMGKTYETKNEDIISEMITISA